MIWTAFISSVVFGIYFISGTLCKQVCKAFKVTVIENKVYKQTNSLVDANAHVLFYLSTYI